MNVRAKAKPQPWTVGEPCHLAADWHDEMEERERAIRHSSPR